MNRADGPSARAIFYAPVLAFHRPVPPVLPTVFRKERARAFDPATPTGFVALDQGESLGSPWPATSPTMLARYVVIEPGNVFGHRLASTGEVYYAIRGAGTTEVGNERIAWRQGDVFALPGGCDVRHASQRGGLLMLFTNEPELAYLGAGPPHGDARTFAPTLFPAAETDRHLAEIHSRTGIQRSAGKSVVFVTELMAARNLTTPTFLAAMNTLEPGGDQRPHRHAAAALTLCVCGEGVHSQIGGEKIGWEPDTLIVTPPNAVHSHHNRGTSMMRAFIVQDTGLHTDLRTTGYQTNENDLDRKNTTHAAR